jgi:RimJ/RimL family protein N-acetyltransferase
MLLLAWRNDDDAVRNSGSRRAVSDEDHRHWFAAALDDPARPIWIAERDGHALGMVRVEVKDGAGEVSVVVDARARGRGVGRDLLIALQDTVRGECMVGRLWARVRLDNTASLRCFAHAGFEDTGRDGDLAVVTWRGAFRRTRVAQMGGAHAIPG